MLPFSKDRKLEEIIELANQNLLPFEQTLIGKFSLPEHPTIFIIGTQRSGSTLLTQLIITYFKVGYISNLNARFWLAPYFGALITRDLQQRQRSARPDFNSELGATYGFDGPHEFGFFWNRWIPHGETHQVDLEEIDNIDVDYFHKELAALEAVFDAPMIFKNAISFTLNIPLINELIPKSYFIVCERDPIYVAQSTLLSRLRAKKRNDYWFSVKPREYTWLRKQPYAEQIAGQIYFTNRRIEETLSTLAPQRYLRVRYEDICASPSQVMDTISTWLSKSDCQLESTGLSVPGFQNSNKQKVSDDEFKLLGDAIQYFIESQDINR